MPDVYLTLKCGEVGRTPDGRLVIVTNGICLRCRDGKGTFEERHRPDGDCHVTPYEGMVITDYDEATDFCDTGELKSILDWELEKVPDELAAKVKSAWATMIDRKVNGVEGGKKPG